MITPTIDYRKTHFKTPSKLHKGLDDLVYGMIGRVRQRSMLGAELLKKAERISDEAGKMRHLSDRLMNDRLSAMQDRFRRQGRGYDDILDEVMSVLVAVAERTIGLKPYPVQIMGAMAMYNGYLVEMATGEGKSLTACLPAVLAAWTGRPCHIVTVNDYLAGRDAVEFAKFYNYCGVTSGHVTGLMVPESRKKNYSCGVVYTTSKELVADFLRDRLLLGNYHNFSRRTLHRMLLPHWQAPDGITMRGLDTVIVDEADSVLIDEAVTPLIISRQLDNKPMEEVYKTANEIAENLVEGRDYRINLKYKEIRLKDEGLAKIRQCAESLPAIWQGEARREELIKQTLTAREFYHHDKQYVIQDGKVVIVDEFTGRLMPNRTWRHGLHQAVEAKEGLDISSPSETMSRLSFQRFFRLFRKLSGMTGTGRAAAGEFWHIYGLPVLPIPTNRPCKREMLPDLVFSNMEYKQQAIIDEISSMHQARRPVLVGTRSVKASETLARLLEIRGLEFSLLNAVRHELEAAIVAAAGEAGKITIATNMAGRGTDIKLGRGVAKLGGLHVIATERHESARIDRQLFGRCARQGDPGSARAFICVEDELIQRFVPRMLANKLSWAVERKLPISDRLSRVALSIAQNTAQRLAYKQRRNVLVMDTWLEDSLAFTGSSQGF